MTENHNSEGLDVPPAKASKNRLKSYNLNFQITGGIFNKRWSHKIIMNSDGSSDSKESKIFSKRQSKQILTTWHHEWIAYKLK